MITLDRFYTSKPWRQLVDTLKIERADADGNIVCERCGKTIVKRYDCIGHHKTELTEDNVNDALVALNPDNVMLVCFDCHNAIHDRWQGNRQSVYIVNGSPCAGKTTWVSNHANHDDLVVDLDRLYQAISGAKPHEHPGRVRSNVFGLRDCLYDQIKTRKGKWRNAWVISSKTGLELQRDIDLLGAELITIDTDRQTCINNLLRDPNGRDIDEWTEYINDYFDRVTLPRSADCTSAG